MLILHFKHLAHKCGNLFYYNLFYLLTKNLRMKIKEQRREENDYNIFKNHLNTRIINSSIGLRIKVYALVNILFCIIRMKNLYPYIFISNLLTYSNFHVNYLKKVKKGKYNKYN